MVRWLVLLAACATVPPPPPDVPALIVRPSDQSRAALSQAVSAALGVRVTLSDYALTQSSELIIERMERRDESGVRVQGRETAMPEHFRLVMSGADCVLVHDGTGRRYRLNDTECAPEMR